MVLAIPGRNTIDDERIAEIFCKNIQPNFDFDIRERISIRTDNNQFLFLEDSSVWEQERGRAPMVHEVYWDGVWICDFSDADDIRKTIVSFLKGFNQQYEKQTISLNTPTEMEMFEQEVKELEEKEAHERELDRLVERMPEDDPEQSMAKNILRDIRKEKKGKKLKGRK